MSDLFFEGSGRLLIQAKVTFFYLSLKTNKHIFDMIRALESCKNEVKKHCLPSMAPSLACGVQGCGLESQRRHRLFAVFIPIKIDLCLVPNLAVAIYCKSVICRNFHFRSEGLAPILKNPHSFAIPPFCRGKRWD